MIAPRTSSFLIFSALLLAFLTGCTGPKSAQKEPPRSHGELPADPQPESPERAEEPPRLSDLERFLQDIEGDGPLWTAIATTHGEIHCQLFPEEAPITVANFVGLARGLKAFYDPELNDAVSDIPFYSGVIFHRVIPDFLIQAGDRSGVGNLGPGYTIPDEFSDRLRHDRPGVLSMANQGPNTGGSQFFITERPAPHLDDRHTIFGHCHSPDIIRSISHMPTQSMNRPIAPAPEIISVSFYRDQKPRLAR